MGAVTSKMARAKAITMKPGIQYQSSIGLSWFKINKDEHGYVLFTRGEELELILGDTPHDHARTFRRAMAEGQRFFQVVSVHSEKCAFLQAWFSSTEGRVDTDERAVTIKRGHESLKAVLPEVIATSYNGDPCPCGLTAMDAHDYMNHTDSAFAESTQKISLARTLLFVPANDIALFRHMVQHQDHLDVQALEIGRAALKSLDGKVFKRCGWTTISTELLQFVGDAIDKFHARTNTHGLVAILDGMRDQVVSDWSNKGLRIMECLQSLLQDPEVPDAAGFMAPTIGREEILKEAEGTVRWVMTNIIMTDIARHLLDAIMETAETPDVGDSCM